MKDRLKDDIERLTDDPGVYLFKDRAGKVLYVGKAKALRTRARNYLRDGADGRFHIQFLLAKAESLDCIVTATEQEALILENNLIKKYQPRYNIFLKDDKTYVHLRMDTRHAFPRITVVRRPKRDGAQYYGPFASAGSVRQTLRTLGRIFPMRTCTDAELASRKRPCLYYYIKRCPAPCVGKVTGDEYAETVRRVTMFLKGKEGELLKTLRDRMDLQAAERRYEAAARTRDQVYAVQRILERQHITSTRPADRDVFATARANDKLVIQRLSIRDGEVSGGASYVFENALVSTGDHVASFLGQYYLGGAPVPGEVVCGEEIPDASALEELLSERRRKRVKVVVPQRGERVQQLALAETNARVALEEKSAASERNRDLLADLQELLSLQRFPRRIECYDISNIRGTDAVGSGVCFVDGEPAKNLYRHYRIKTVTGSDDYAMMREVLERRIARGQGDGDLPDLLVVDGGRGQLGVALDVRERLGADEVDMVGIAKVREGSNNRKVRGKERIYMPDLPEPLLLEGNSDALYLLERIRDEAHRFAITHHKKLRGKKLGRSALDEIPGVGPTLKQRLLTEFGSVARIRRASIQTLSQVKGVSPRLAQAVKDALS